MSTRGGNGDVPPPDDSDLPELPPEWRSIVIPDDASALADEAAAVRRELRERQRSSPPVPRVSRRTFLGRLLTPPHEAALRIPLVIMGIAIITTLTSLFLVSWLGQPRTPTAQRTPAGQTPTSGRTLPALDLVAEDGSSTPLRGLLPAVFVITDGCACDRLLQETLRATPPGVRVIAVSRAPASGPPGGPAPGVLHLLDQAGSLRAVSDLPEPAGGGAVLLVDERNEILRTIPSATTADEYRGTLEQLA
ncbi:hypothetical protein [Catenuloplanes atrovinosus]|uniref:Uncharacterized protein n=1 Tax=Catenuloplanes atrovinosus TaxID=137266 RepID=A0AAE4CD72_9ACTN|nr:hypothetical protein [Catenuloplanes atrovinosus]MDR7280331.1 hypothetical protein [Catenuloplanes atrovinosus]